MALADISADTVEYDRGEKQFGGQDVKSETYSLSDTPESELRETRRSGGGRGGRSIGFIGSINAERALWPTSEPAPAAANDGDGDTTPSAPMTLQPIGPQTPVNFAQQEPEMSPSIGVIGENPDFVADGLDVGDPDGKTYDEMTLDEMLGLNKGMQTMDKYGNWLGTIGQIGKAINRDQRSEFNDALEGKINESYVNNIGRAMDVANQQIENPSLGNLAGDSEDGQYTGTVYGSDDAWGTPEASGGAIAGDSEDGQYTGTVFGNMGQESQPNLNLGLTGFSDAETDSGSEGDVTLEGGIGNDTLGGPEAGPVDYGTLGDTAGMASALGGSNDAGGGGGGGGGDAGTVICTALHSAGRLSNDLYELEARHLATMNRWVAYGYRAWAVGYVERSRRHPWMLDLAEPLAKAWVQQIAHTLEPEKHAASTLGRIVRLVGEPACWVIGIIAGGDTAYQHLYAKGEQE